jgi:hypothetical protein
VIKQASRKTMEMQGSWKETGSNRAGAHEDQQIDAKHSTKLRSHIRPGQTLDVRVPLYCLKPPFPSDGGFAAASAGRSGLRPEK